MHPSQDLQCRPELLQQWQHDVQNNPKAFLSLLQLSPQYVAMLVHDAARARELDGLINQPHTADFLEATRLEAAHQVVRWGHGPRRGKSAENWYWLVGYLAGKCLRACITGDRTKALHHTISSAAALMNWHAAIAADTTGCGLGPDDDIKPKEVEAPSSSGTAALAAGEGRTSPAAQRETQRILLGPWGWALVIAAAVVLAASALGA